MRKLAFVLVGALALVAASGGLRADETKPAPADVAAHADAAVADPRADLEGRLDLAELRRLAVQNGGRRKPFDSFAREQVKLVLGQDAFKSEDPVYTFLSLLFEPDRWMPIRAVKIHNLQLVKLFDIDNRRDPSRIAFADLERNEAFKKRLEDAQQKGGMTGPNDNAVLELNHRFLIFANLARMLHATPRAGADEEAKWLAVSELDGGAEAVAEHGGQARVERPNVLERFRALGGAFRAGDAAGVNDGLRALVVTLTTLQGPLAPERWRMDLEVALNRVQPFHVAWMVFFLAALTLGGAVMTQSRGARRAGTALHVGGVLLALFGIAARTIIVERAPVANLYEAMTFAIFASVIVGTVFELTYRNAIFGTASATFGFLALLLADLSPNMDRAINPLVPVLRSYWLNIHVTCMLTSYGTFAVAFLLGVIYFAKYLHAKGLPRFAIVVPALVSLAGTGVLFWRAYTHQMPILRDYAIALVGSPALGIGATYAWLALSGRLAAKVAYEDQLFLNTMERYLYRVCQVGFVVITTGIILGAVWANESWGRYWDWDPKETWAFITWLMYGVFIHGRIAGLFRGPKAAIWGIVGFYSVLFTFFGVSFVLPGLHSYLKG